MVANRRQDRARVDASGAIEPVEVDARRELAGREGSYRVLPSPRGVVLMRAELPVAVGVIRLAGEINAPGTVCDVFMMLTQMGWRGQLVLSDTGVTRSLFFDKGNVLGAQTNVAEERLGAVMYRYGALSEEDLARVAAHTRRGARFGAVALELELISQRDVYRCLRHQVEEISFSAFAQASGTFCFLDGFDASKLVSHHVIAAQALLMDGVTRMDEIRYFREKIPSADYVPVRVPSSPGRPHPDYARTFEVIDGTRSLTELGRLTGRGEFAVTKDVYGLERSGHVIIRPPARSGGARDILEVANQALRAVHVAADAAGKGRELRKGLASFAGGGSGTHGVLFLMAGPEADGTLDVERVAENIQRFGSAAERTLRRTLYDYVSFAIFCVGAAAGRHHEERLGEDLRAALAALEP